MATVGALNIDLQAQTASFIADLGKARQALASNTAAMNKALKSLETGFTGVQAIVGRFAGILGIGFGVAFLKQTLDAAGGVSDLAQQLGVSTDALQAYQFAASQSGVKQEELQAGLASLTKTIGLAAAGNKQAVDSFNELGVGVLDARGNVRSTEDVLRDVADALSKITDPATQARLAVEIMSKTGQRLLPILTQGSAGLDAFTEAAKKLGLIISGDTIKNADELSDKIAEMEKQWSNLAATMLGKIAPFLSDAAKGFQRLAGAIGDTVSFAQKLSDLNAEIAKLEAQQGSTTIAGRARAAANADRLAGLKKQRDDLLATGPSRTDFHTTGAGNPTPVDPKAESAKKRLDEYILSLQAEQSQLDLNNRARAVAQKMYQAEAIARAGNIKLTDDQRAQIEQITGAIYDNTEAEAQQDAALQSALDGLKVYADTQQEISDNKGIIEALKAGNLEYEKQSALLQILNKYKAAGIEIDAQVLANAKEQAETLGVQRDQIDKLKDANKDWKDGTRDATQAIGTAFEDAVLKGEKLRDVFAGLLEDISRIILRLTVTKPLENSLTKLLDSSSTSGDSGGGFLGGIISSIGSWFSSPTNDVGSQGMVGLYAEGGRPPVGMPAIVGEEGPELFVPDVAGTVIPNKDLAASQSGGTYYIDARGADREGLSRLERMIQAINGSIEKRSVAAVVDARKRTPALFSA